MLTVRYDPVCRLILTEAAGFLTTEDVLGWSAALKDCIAQARRHTGEVRHLVVGASAAIQSAEVMALFSAERVPPEGPGDRLAVVVATTLGRMQAERNLPTDQERTFPSEEEAVQWLQADRTAGARPSSSAG